MIFGEVLFPTVSGGAEINDLPKWHKIDQENFININNDLISWNHCKIVLFFNETKHIIGGKQTPSSSSTTSAAKIFQSSKEPLPEKLKASQISLVRMV